jgi:hypothetical protein
MYKEKQLVVRIPQDLRDELEPIAAAERRSLRNTICVALAQWLEDRNAAIARVSRARVSRASREQLSA